MDSLDSGYNLYDEERVLSCVLKDINEGETFKVAKCHEVNLLNIGCQMLIDG
jgi:hypothetical protein